MIARWEKKVGQNAERRRGVRGLLSNSHSILAGLHRLSYYLSHISALPGICAINPKEDGSSNFPEALSKVSLVTPSALVLPVF